MSGEVKLLCDTLLCSMIKAGSSMTKADLVEAVVSQCGEEVVVEARKKLFTAFPAQSNNGKSMIEQRRNSVKAYVEDVATQLEAVGKTACEVVFVHPWNEDLIKLSTAAEKLASVMYGEKNREVMEKMENLETSLMAKNQAVLDAVLKLTSQVSGVSGGFPPLSAKGNGGQPSFSNVASKNVRSFVPGITPMASNGIVSTPSKRARVDGDGGGGVAPSVRQNDRARGVYPRDKPVEGTGGARSDGGNRKMKTAPADIFIWGVHPSTTPEDIVEDLGYSGIVVTVGDIEKKTRQDEERPAGLDSYKITVKAEDLSKALSPDVWPLRVRCRQWVHYSNRRSARSEGGGMFGGRGGRGPQQQQQQQQPGGGQAAGWTTVTHGRGGQEQQTKMLSTGMFDVLKTPIVENK